MASHCDRWCYICGSGMLGWPCHRSVCPLLYKTNCKGLRPQFCDATLFVATEDEVVFHEEVSSGYGTFRIWRFVIII